MSSRADLQPLEWPDNFGGILGGAGESGWFSQVGLGRKIILWMVGCYLVLNVGFMYVRIPPVGPGIPIGELILVFSLLALNQLIVIPRMSKEVWMFPIVVWWAYSLIRALYDIRVGGAWALRDASQEIESLYLIVGFWLVNRTIYLRYFFRWLPRLLVVIGLYSLIFPVAKTLQGYSPSVPGMNASVRTLLFQVVGTPSLALWSAAWLLMSRPGEHGSHIRMRHLAACFLVAYTAAFSQERTVYMQIIALAFLFLAVRRKVAFRWIMILILGAGLIAAVSVSGISIKGRVGHKISLDFIVHHFESSSGQGEAGEGTGGTAGSVAQRFGFWRHILIKMESSPSNMAFGLGFGIPLTNFNAAKDILVREPHNSYISVWARLGVFGISLWLLMQTLLLRNWWKSYRLTRRMNWVEDQQNLFLLLIYWVLILVFAIAEPGLEMPFLAIPYYFFFGVMLRYGMYLREAAASGVSDLS